MSRAAVALFLLLFASPAVAQNCVATVTNTNDSGPGSLRAGIEEMNALCRVSYTVRFQIPGAIPFHTIRLATPLPRITASWVVIAGETQTAFGGNTNREGPEIELDGSALADGSGLQVCGGRITDLVINGFPANALVLGGRECFPFGSGEVARSYIGTDPGGTRAVPNTRGIWLLDSPARYGEYQWDIHHNVISGNKYSGVFVAGGPHSIHDNVIGLTQKRHLPLGNGASGVAIMAEGRGTDVMNNHIGFNFHFGVGLARGASRNAIFNNTFQANEQLAIDWGLDGVTPGVGDAGIPTITSVRIENGVWLIGALTSPQCQGEPYLTFYSNDEPDPSGYGEGQYLLGSQLPKNASTQVEFRYRGDLRGKWVTATQTCERYTGALVQPNYDWQAVAITTSEFSRAVKVD